MSSLLIFVISLRLVGVILSSYVASFSSDTKVLAAYKSVVHINIILGSIFIFSSVSLISSFLMSLGHSYIRVLIFYLLGILHHEVGSRIIENISGGFSINLVLAVSLILTILINRGIPPTITFFGELYYLSFLFSSIKGVLYSVSVYFLISFYFSVYFMVHSLKSKYYLVVSLFSLQLSFVFLFGVLNLVWLL